MVKPLTEFVVVSDRVYGTIFQRIRVITVSLSKSVLKSMTEFVVQLTTKSVLQSLIELAAQFLVELNRYLLANISDRDVKLFKEI
jgi:hypothetical protein